MRQAMLVAAFWALAQAGSAQSWERTLEEKMAEAGKQAQEAARERQDAIRRSCKTIVDRETSAYRAKEAELAAEGSRRYPRLLAMAVDFRRSFSEPELRELKKANIERKRLDAAGVRPQPGGEGILGYWEGKIDGIVDARYRSFAPGRKSFDCPDGATAHRDYSTFGQRNGLLWVDGSCWGSDGEKPVKGVEALAWLIGRQTEAPAETTVYAAACGGLIKEEIEDYRYHPTLFQPVCVVMNLLDGSLSKEIHGPQLAALKWGDEGWRMRFLPGEGAHLKQRMIDLKVPECAETN